MNKFRLIIQAIVFVTLMCGLGAVVHAQNLRSWVSGFGNDNNTCLRTAPCRTFAGAIVKTQANGEINCLDPEGYGAVTIIKSITIDCEDTQGSILGSNTNGIVVNLDSSDTMRIVRLRGLTITGQGTGNRGIWVVNTPTPATTTLHVDQVVIDGFKEGILFNSSGGQLVVRNSIIQDCSSSGLMVDSGIAGELVSATLEGSSFIHNAEGIHVETSAFVTAANCNISNNSLDGAILLPAENYLTDLNFYNCLIASNGKSGISVISSATNAIVRLSGNHIVNNAAAGVFNASEVRTRGNNTIAGNSVDVQGAALVMIPSL